MLRIKSSKLTKHFSLFNSQHPLIQSVNNFKRELNNAINENYKEKLVVGDASDIKLFKEYNKVAYKIEELSKFHNYMQLYNGKQINRNEDYYFYKRLGYHFIGYLPIYLNFQNYIPVLMSYSILSTSLIFYLSCNFGITGYMVLRKQMQKEINFRRLVK